MKRLCALLLFIAQAARAEPPEEIARVRVLGGGSDTAALQRAVGLAPGAPASAEALRRAMDALWGTGLVDDVAAESEAQGSRVLLTFRVRQRPTIAKLSVVGLPPEAAGGTPEIRQGQRLNPARLMREEERLRVACEAAGYAAAHVERKVRPLGRPAGRAEVILEVTPGPIAERRVLFAGNRRVHDTILRGVLDEGEGFRSILTEDTLERDVLLISALYYDRGFVLAQVRAERHLSDDERTMTALFTIEEGEQFSVGSIAFKGDLPRPAAQILAQMEQQQGTTFSRARLARDLGSLQTEMRDRGHALVEVTPLTSVRRESRLVDLTIEVTAGPLVRLGAISVVGQRKVPETELRRRLSVSSGELYNETRLGESKTALQLHERIRRVEVSTRQAGPGVVDVTVEVEER